MKGAGLSGLILIIFAIISVALFLGLGQKTAPEIVLIANASFNSTTNQTIYTTTNSTIVINNTIPFFGLLPAANVTNGTFGANNNIDDGGDSGNYIFASKLYTNGGLYTNYGGQMDGTYIIPSVNGIAWKDRFNQFAFSIGGTSTNIDMWNSAGNDMATFDRAANDITFYSTLHVTNITGATLNMIENPTGNKTFSMAQNNILWSFVNPNLASDQGAFEIQATGGGYKGDLVHIHQHTGNPAAGFELLHIEGIDSDTVGLNITVPNVALQANGNVRIGGNVSYISITNFCEYHKGTQVNYSRCMNATGQITETLGVFPI